MFRSTLFTAILIPVCLSSAACVVEQDWEEEELGTVQDAITSESEISSVTAKVACGDDDDVYTNWTNSEQCVAVNLSTSCTGVSEAGLRGTTKYFEAETDTTRSGSFTVRTGQKLYIECGVDGVEEAGCCSYELSVTTGSSCA